MNSKEKLLQAALILFNQHGYHATSLSQITELSGSPRGSVYYYFPDGKEQLAKEAIIETGEKIVKNIQQTLEQYDHPAVGIYQYMKVIANRVDSTDERTTISLVAMSSEVWSTNEMLRQACEAVYQKWEQVYVEHLMQHGYNEMEAKRLGTYVQSLIEGAYTLSVTKKNTEPLHIAAETIIRLLGFDGNLSE